MSEQVQIPFDPQVFDVVCTKLRTWNTKHPGNKFFNQLIANLAASVTEETMRKTAQQLIDTVAEKGGRFLRLSDADCMSGNKPSMCTVLGKKQRNTKVLRTLRMAYLKHNGTVVKRVRNPASRRKKTKTYELLSGSIPIHPYALQLLAAVMNGVRNVPYRELDKPGEPYTIETEPEQLRLMRLQLRHRLVGAKEAMMPAVEFGHAIMNLWGGRVVVQKIPLPTTAAATDSAAADKVGSSNTPSPGSNNNSGPNNNNNPNSSTDQTKKTILPIPLAPKPTAALPPQSKESSQQKNNNETKDQLRTATRQKMMALLTSSGGSSSKRSSGGTTTTTRPISRATGAVRGSLASKTLPNMGGDDADKQTSTPGATTPATTTTALHHLESPAKTSQNKAGATADKPKRGSLASKTLPARAAAGKTATTSTSTTKPVRGSLASKTLPGAATTSTSKTSSSSPKRASSPSKRKKTTTTTAKKKDPSREIGSLVHNLEQADTDSPFVSSPRRLTRLGQTGLTAKVETLMLLEGGKGAGIIPRKVSLPPPVAPSLGDTGTKDSKN